MIPNLNWLIHMAFARQDYKYCHEVIEYQFNETFDHEYLYYIKVSVRVCGSAEARGRIILPIVAVLHHKYAGRPAHPASDQAIAHLHSCDVQ